MQESAPVEVQKTRNPIYERSDTVYQNMRDPKFLKQFYRFKTLNMLQKDEIEGSSPPDVFIGRIGYPYVYVGPLVPPQFGDTSIMSTPEEWVGKSIQEIIEYRSMLIRGMHRTKITNVESGKIEGTIKELALADRFVYADAKLTRKPNMMISMGENSQPFGPSAPLKELSLGGIHTNTKVENAHSDTAMNASTAIIELYGKGVMVSKIQKALSAGLLGIGANRKFVPTRWSITAVDDTLGRENLKTVKQCDTIDSYRVYHSVALDNRWIVIMAPGEWSYELVEAFYPKTTWNLDGQNISIFSSHELYSGRKEYAEIGGCYYAARLAASDVLLREQRQASVIVLREAHPGYILPVGVWNVREHVRDTLKREPLHFATLNETLNYVATKMEIPIPVWMKNSSVLRYLSQQKRLFN
ncbi:MAG: hypothetical protein KGH71_05390, partial [Candidatus Micrarchaeota archaeon]|nr:hypothetical protein [Candidatus Micrarchaeota archaeon]